MTSLDELLEKVLRTIYASWFTPALIEERTEFNGHRALLARQLRSLPAGDVEAGELYVRAFFEEISLLPAVSQAAGDELTRALNLKRERLVRTTNLAAARVEALAALLEAENPPLFVLQQLVYRDRMPPPLRSADPADRPLNPLIETLSNVLQALDDNVDVLSESSRTEIAKLRQKLNQAFEAAVDGATVVAKEAVVHALDAIAANAEALPIVYAALRQGKAEAAPQTRGGYVERGGKPDNRVAVSSRLADLLRGVGDGSMVEFTVQVTFPAAASSGQIEPLLVELVRQPDPNFDSKQVRYLQKVRLERSALAECVPLQVVLLTQAFDEASGNTTRTLVVHEQGTYAPALFLLKSDAARSKARIAIRLEMALKTAEFEVEIQSSRYYSDSTFEKGLESISRSVAAEETSVVSYTSHVDFPAQVKERSSRALIVQLARRVEETDERPEDLSLEFQSTEDAKLIEVVLTAPGFEEPFQPARRAIRVWRDREAEPAIFWLRARDSLGKTPLTVDFYHAGRMLGSVTYESEIVQEASKSTEKAQRISEVNQLDSPPVNPPPPADLTLRITKDDQTNTLSFALHASNPELGYDQRDMGQIPLNANPRRFLTDTFEQLSRMARQAMRNVETLSEADSAVEEKELIRIGEYLFEKLFPEPLRDEYWRLKELREAGLVRSLLIISDEPWIPWELIKPYKYDEAADTELRDDFLAVAFQLCRWLAGRGLLAKLTVHAASVVIPELDLAYVQREKEYFDALKQRGLQVNEPLRSRDEVLDAARDGSFQVLHLAAHGNFNPDKAEQSPLVLQDQQELWPSDLSGSQARALRKERPLVFLNACHSGQVEFSLTGLGGWAEQMVNSVGVGAFVGSLWEVNDLLAAEFATYFYDQLISGAPLSVAFSAARHHIRQRQPANPTWLAYTLYGDPNAQTAWQVR